MELVEDLAGSPEGHHMVAFLCGATDAEGEITMIPNAVSL